MKRYFSLQVAALLAAFPAALPAQPAANQTVISVYRAAPGHQVELVRWLAQQDRIAEAAGTPRSQLYVHMNGAEWDFLIIQPPMTAVQQQAFDAAATRLGIDQGPRVGLELRKHISWHNDTAVMGPISPAEYLQRVGER